MSRLVGCLAVAALLASTSAVAQIPQATLPEVVVTAPSGPPAVRPERTPGMLGKMRVEEDKWPEIPCGGARIGIVTGGKCQVGPMLITAMAYLGASNVPNAYGPCDISHQLVTADIGRFSVEADVTVFDPYKITADQYNSRCTVWSGYEHLPGDFQDMNQVARRGVDWRNFVPGNGQSGSESTIEFSDGPRGCVAVERLGPPWHGGFVWVLHATACQAAAIPAIARAELDAAINAIRITVYDPNGNLRGPPVAAR